VSLAGDALALALVLLQMGAFSSSAEASSTPASTEQTPTAEQQPESAAPPARDASLSNERTLTTWAHPAEIAPIYAKPEAHARKIATTHLETEDGFLEAYLLLASHTEQQGQVWVKLRIPGRPNGRTGWVRREDLGGFHVTHWLVVVSLHKRRLTAYYKGHRRFVAPVGVGKPSSPTPPGHFWIRERFRLANRSNPYWPYALGTSDYSTLTDWPGGGVVGIHGDFGEPQLIPGDPSHGCIRMRDADIARLAPRLTVGTPVDIV
jgi:L,D-transpeptidase catalytic domain